MEITNNVLNKEVRNNDFQDEKKELLRIKRNEVFNFLSNIKTLLIFLIVLVSFLSNFQSIIVTMFEEEELTNLDKIVFILQITINILVPIGFGLLYIGAFKKNSKIVNLGFIFLLIYLTILMLLIITIIVLVFILIFYRNLHGKLIIYLLLFTASLFWILSLFVVYRKFVKDLKVGFNYLNTEYPTSEKLIYLPIIFIVLLILFALILGPLLTKLKSMYSVYGYREEVAYINYIKSQLVFIHIATGLSIIVQGYIIYYLKQLNNMIKNFKPLFSKKLEEHYNNQNMN